MFYEFHHSASADYFSIETGEDLTFPAHIHSSFELVTLQSGSMKLAVEQCDLLAEFEESFDAIRVKTLLSGEYDTENAIIKLNAGAGGTEACDWTQMLLRMYERWCESNNYTYEIIDSLDGEEAGLKKVSLLIKGLYAYGYLKCERGVHRLVRLSPFDSNNRRHTSFASVEVTPEIADTIDIVIEDNDWTITTLDRKPSAHFEHTVLVTKDGYQILTGE